MIEQKYFPAYLPEDNENVNERAMLTLTYNQVLLIPSALRLLDEFLSIKNPLKKLTFNPHLSESEKNALESIHNACINCALSQELHFRTRDKNL